MLRTLLATFAICLAATLGLGTTQSQAQAQTQTWPAKPARIMVGGFTHAKNRLWINPMQEAQ